MNTTKPFRWHPKSFNTSHVLPIHAANNNPYGQPDPIEGDDLPFGDETIKACDDETGVKCYSCGGYFPESSCVANMLDEGILVAVCETCAEGRVG